MASVSSDVGPLGDAPSQPSGNGGSVVEADTVHPSSGMQPTVRIISGGRSPATPRYRHSCDRCQKVKVRCSQDKPRCARCSKKDLRCVYSECRAVGRPRVRPRPPEHAPEDFEEGPGRIRSLPLLGTVEAESVSWRANDSMAATKSGVIGRRKLAAPQPISAIEHAQEADSNAQEPETRGLAHAAPPLSHVAPTWSAYDEPQRTAADPWCSRYQVPATTGAANTWSPSYNALTSPETVLDKWGYIPAYDKPMGAAQESCGSRYQVPVQTGTAPRASNGFMHSATNSWGLSHQASPNTGGIGAAPAMSSFADSRAQTRSLACPYHPEADCYVAILEQTAKLERSIARTTLAPPIDLVLKAEKNLMSQQRRLFACAGHNLRWSCLVSDRPVLLSLALLADRVLGLLEDMFRLATTSSLKVDKDDINLLYGKLDVVPSPSAQRLRRSYRRPATPPRTSPVLRESCEMRIGEVVVGGKARSVAMTRVLKLRVSRVLGELKALAETRGWTSEGEAQRRQGLDGSKYRISYDSVLGNTAYTMIDDLIRRCEELHKATVFLLSGLAGRTYGV